MSESPVVHGMNSLDEWSDSVKQFMATRTGATCAHFIQGYLQPGMNLLDCGCGEGTITVDLATYVATGRVTGVDIAESSLERARQLAEQRGLDHVRFEKGSIYDLPYTDAEFDVVFSHALFEHLTDKPRALREIKRVLRPGGIVGLRAPDMGAVIVEPSDDLLDLFWTLFRRIRSELGGVNNMGRQLPGLLQQAGFHDVQGSASFISFGTPARVQLFAATFSSFALRSPYAVEWLNRGWVEQETLHQISARWREWAQQPGAFAAEAWGEAVGFVDGM